MQPVVQAVRYSTLGSAPVGSDVLRCGYCGRRLSDSGGSLDFCDVTCQEQWYAGRVDQLPDGHGTLVRPALRTGWF